MNLSTTLLGEGELASSSSREIPLTKGYVALVDAADYEWLSAHKWYVSVDRTSVYALCWDAERGRNVAMHVMIAGGSSDLVDHRNGNGLDNRRLNLRPCSHEQNRQNRGPNNGRRFKGVSPHEHRWRAVIKASRVTHHLGRFDTEEEAARAYDAAAVRLHGEFAWLNFPEEVARVG